MPRHPRNFLSCNFFHLIVQGLNKEYIFYSDFNKKFYLTQIQKYSNKFNIKILAYCIMTNHAHILIYANDIQDISQFMKCVNVTYARYYNSQNNRVGPVFRDRFLSQPINSEVHLFRCIAYIHQNPVKAHLVTSLSDYSYSSYNNYLNKNGIVNNEILNLILGAHNINYMDLLSLYHHTFINDIADTSDDNSFAFLNVVSYFKNLFNLSLEQILKDTSLTCLLIKELHINGLSIRKISNHLNIEKNTVYKYLKS